MPPDTPERVTVTVTSHPSARDVRWVVTLAKSTLGDDSWSVFLNGDKVGVVSRYVSRSRATYGSTRVARPTVRRTFWSGRDMSGRVRMNDADTRAEVLRAILRTVD